MWFYITSLFGNIVQRANEHRIKSNVVLTTGDQHAAQFFHFIILLYFVERVGCDDKRIPLNTSRALSVYSSLVIIPLLIFYKHRSICDDHTHPAGPNSSDDHQNHPKFLPIYFQIVAETGCASHQPNIRSVAMNRETSSRQCSRLRNEHTESSHFSPLLHNILSTVFVSWFPMFDCIKLFRNSL